MNETDSKIAQWLVVEHLVLRLNILGLVLARVDSICDYDYYY